MAAPIHSSSKTSTISGAIDVRVFFAGMLSSTFLGVGLGLVMAILHATQAWTYFSSSGSRVAGLVDRCTIFILGTLVVVFDGMIAGAVAGLFAGGLAAVLCRNAVRRGRILFLAAGWAAPVALAAGAFMVAMGQSVHMPFIAQGNAVSEATFGALTGAAFGALLVPVFSIVERGLASRRQFLGAVLGALCIAPVSRFLLSLYGWYDYHVSSILPESHVLELLVMLGGSLVGIIIARRTSNKPVGSSRL
jgi:hypothetical protein